ncbi:hypothetical protein B0H13DRAFT_2511385 [Mycena leptocephala]|nr:hypothetical protein B0H13DRAFT_2511385 [Mycena leptocephala]
MPCACTRGNNTRFTHSLIRPEAAQRRPPLAAHSPLARTRSAGTAGNFAILAKTGVSSVPNSAVSGNVGVSPATITSVTGFSLVQDVSTQFWTSTQAGPRFRGIKGGSHWGSILTPGLYKWTTAVTISTDITIAGGPADTWIFQISGTLTQAPNMHITLTGGALSSNIIWVVAGTVAVGANAVFEGNILAQTDVVMGTDTIDFGCIYAQTDVALQEATVFSTPPASSSSSPTSSGPASSTPVSSTAPPTSAPASSSPVITASSTKKSFSRKYTTSTRSYKYYGY